MKDNCMIISAEKMLKVMKPCSWGKNMRNFKSPGFYKDGTFSYYENIGGSWVLREHSPNDCAEAINMPLWEVVTVDNGGIDEYALMFFEDNDDRKADEGGEKPNLINLYTEYISACGLSTAFLHWLEGRAHRV